MKVDPRILYQGLLARAVPHIHAMGILANMQAESGFNPGIQETHPIAGRGGYGLAQWTGPRRRALERFAKAYGRPVSDWEVQLDYLLTEDDTDHYLDQRFETIEDATLWFLHHWERPAKPNESVRVAYVHHLANEVTA